jgi:peptidoglycan hydrolase-like protein with peptidoglycan-binding domain
MFKKHMFWWIGGAVVAAGVVYFVYEKSASAAPSALPKAGGGGGAGDHVSQTSGGQLTTMQAQTILKALGVYGLANDTGNPATVPNLPADQQLASIGIDGGWGTQTSGAVSAFQGLQGLPQTGQVDPTTASHLISAYHGIGGA